MVASKTSDHIQIIIKVQNLRQEPNVSSKGPNQDLKDMDIFAAKKSRWRVKIQIMVVSKTIDHTQIKIKMPNPSQEPPASSKAQN